jgi:type II secretory pathway pseudopilin PulG
MPASPSVRDERGETLLELIVALGILGIAVVAVASGIAVSVVASGRHRDEANAGTYLHNYAEQVSARYTSCGASAPSLAAQTGFQAPSLSIKYWAGTAFGPSSCTTDPGLQQVTIRLTSSDTRVSESLVVVVRKP